MAFKTVNERSRLNWSTRFQDAAWLPQYPNPIRYRLDCLTTHITILDWTDLDPTAVDVTGTILISVTPDQNAIIDTSNGLERKELTVEANYGTDGQYVETVDWQVRNISGVT